MSELKRCPFCGGKAELVNYGLTGKLEVVQCLDCGARTRVFDPNIKRGESAIDAWNRRTVPTMAQILADVLDGTPLLYPCDKLWNPEGWCKAHCKSGQQEPDKECWLKYAEIMASEWSAKDEV